jgi:hypothetical protein
MTDTNEYNRPDGHEWKCECPECLTHWEVFFSKYEKAQNEWLFDKLNKEQDIY